MDRTTTSEERKFTVTPFYLTQAQYNALLDEVQWLSRTIEFLELQLDTLNVRLNAVEKTQELQVTKWARAIEQAAGLDPRD